MQRWRSYATGKWIAATSAPIQTLPARCSNFIQEHQVKSAAITDGIIGCPHQEEIDYDGEWCPVCEFWHGRDRFTGQRCIKFLRSAATARQSALRPDRIAAGG